VIAALVLFMTYRTEQWQAESDLLRGHWTRSPQPMYAVSSRP
jgi:hypothetical protein